MAAYHSQIRVLPFPIPCNHARCMRVRTTSGNPIYFLTSWQKVIIALSLLCLLPATLFSSRAIFCHLFHSNSAVVAAVVADKWAHIARCTLYYEAPPWHHPFRLFSSLTIQFGHLMLIFSRIVVAPDYYFVCKSADAKCIVARCGYIHTRQTAAGNRKLACTIICEVALGTGKKVPFVCLLPLPSYSHNARLGTFASRLDQRSTLMSGSHLVLFHILIGAVDVLRMCIYA